MQRAPPCDPEANEIHCCATKRAFFDKAATFCKLSAVKVLLRITLIYRIYFRSKNPRVKERVDNENEQLTWNNVTRILIFNGVKIMTNIRAVLRNIIIRNNTGTKCKTNNVFF